MDKDLETRTQREGAIAIGPVTSAVSRGLPQVHRAWRCVYSTGKLAVWATFLYFQRILCVTSAGGFLGGKKVKECCTSGLGHRELSFWPKVLTSNWKNE